MAVKNFMTQQNDNGSELNFGLDEDNNLYLNGKKVVVENKIVLNNFVNFAIFIGGFSTLGLLIVELCRYFAKN